MATSGVTIELSGPIFEKGVGSKLDRAVMSGLEQCAIELTADVQTQLYRHHGWVTGRLKGSIQYRPET
jgi:secreted trypsin-like serine protease